MSYEFYKVLHFTGIFALLIGITLLTAWSLEKTSASLKKWGFIFHGASLVIILVSGFGLAARLGLVGGLPNWVYAKLFIWFLFGAFIAVIKRANLGLKSTLIALVLAIISAYIAGNKPF